MNHVTIGVYSNGEYKINIVKPKHLKDHIEYNKDFRPGRMLFVDGRYVCGGQFKTEYQEKLIKEWEEKISNMKIDNTMPSHMYV